MFLKLSLVVNIFCCHFFIYYFMAGLHLQNASLGNIVRGNFSTDHAISPLQ